VLIEELAKIRRPHSKEPMYLTRRCTWPERTVSRAKESHDVWQSLASEAEQVWSILRSWKALKLWLLVFESKLFQIVLSNNSRKCRFLLSVSSRPKEYWPHTQRPRVSRRDERTV